MKILILGASGMLGSAMFSVLSKNKKWDVVGAIRHKEVKKYFPRSLVGNFHVGCDVLSEKDLYNLFYEVKPDVVINCVSLSKNCLRNSEPLKIIPIYALLPHQLSSLCHDFNCRLIQISTDGVFSGQKGGYIEEDISDAQDLYGVSKYLGELHEPNTISIRTSIIGPELNGGGGLLSWFLSEKNSCQCYSQVVFSGLPTVVLAQIIRDIVIERSDLFGVYHIASNPISKCELLHLIAKIYGKSINIVPNNDTRCDRSLNANRFQSATGYSPPEWPELVELMYSNQIYTQE